MNLQPAVNGGIFQTTFLSMPSDILVEIMKFLCGKDCYNLGLAHNRLRAIEEKAGYRRFNTIEFNWGIRAFDGSRTFYAHEIFADEKLSPSFNHVTADTLIIRVNQLTMDAEENIRVFLKTISFQALDFEVTSETSIFEEAVRKRKGIKNVSIRTSFDRSIVDENMIRRLILSLPAMQKCLIMPSAIHRSAPIIDDEAFLHIVRSSSSNTHLSGWSAITAAGLAAAFEIVYSDLKPRYIFCIVNNWEIRGFVNQLDARFEVKAGEIEHRQSGAKVTVTHLHSTTDCRIKMYWAPSAEQ